MKYIFKVIIAVIAIGFLFTCSGGESKSNYTKVDNVQIDRKSNKGKEVKETAKPGKLSKVRFPRLRMLPENPNVTDYAIGTIGNNKINKRTVQPISVEGEKLVVTGWAIDKQANQLPGDLFVDISGQKFGVAKGKSPKYLKKLFENTTLHKAGYRANIPLSKLSKGKHSLSLYVISSDKKSFYAPKESYEILIK